MPPPRAAPNPAAGAAQFTFHIEAPGIDFNCTTAAALAAKARKLGMRAGAVSSSSSSGTGVGASSGTGRGGSLHLVSDPAGTLQAACTGCAPTCMPPPRHLRRTPANAAGPLCAGIALQKDTPASTVLPLVAAGAVDTVLLLSVRAGFGGQKFDLAVLPKLRALRERFAGKRGQRLALPTTSRWHHC